jgi:hypothetical protein
MFGSVYSFVLIFVTNYLENNSGDYLRKVLHDPLSKLLSSEAIDLEVDPSYVFLLL